MRKSTRRVAAALFAFSLVAAACGDDGGDDASTADTTATAETTAPADTTAPAEEATADTAAAEDPVAAAQAIVDELRQIPTEIPVTTGITEPAPKKKIAWLACELPSCAEVGEDAQAFADALGWELKTINIKSFEPAPGVQQAIDWGADYITITGSPLALFQEQFDAAVAKGIKFAFGYTTEDPQTVDGGIEGLLTTMGDDTSVFTNGGRMASWIIADSKAAANVVMVNIRDFQVLVAEEEGLKAGLAAGCPTCKFEGLPVTIDDLGAGKIPQLVVSYLQENPDTNYVHFAFGGLPTGVSEAIKTAGLADKVTLTGVDFSAPNLQEVVDGTHSVWTSNPKAMALGLMFHACVLDAAGVEFADEREAAKLSTFFIDTPESAKAILDSGGLQNWKGPEGYLDQLKKLWAVG
ncbi:MAG: sugar ABC transporter substrate-binding protein [Actinomycetota bacterium]